MRFRSWTPLLAAAALVLVAMGWQLWRVEDRAWAASAQASTVSLQTYTVNPQWVKAGQPRFQTAEIVRSPDGRSVTGVWTCDGTTTFEWHFNLDEAVYVLEGRVEVRYLGSQFVLEPGQSAIFKAGTTAVWHVPTHLKKVFVLQHPGRLALWWRALRERLLAA
jgi:uncharacterized protein